MLRTSLCIQLKEALNGARLQDPEVTLHIFIQLETFNQFIDRIKPVDTVLQGIKSIHRIVSLNQACAYFGKSWWFRVLNIHGDCCHIVPGTFQVWVFERKPLTEFSLTDSSQRQVYRGYVLVVRFVRDTKSKSDMLKLVNDVNICKL